MSARPRKIAGMPAKNPQHVSDRMPKISAKIARVLVGDATGTGVVGAGVGATGGGVGVPLFSMIRSFLCKKKDLN
ncbi:MAG: hypothetical protein A2048_08435 [Deltaproteobacteria bacterium GWA2_45_12]|nr:MAG: hypothetical protein A2048_08435 [Deltaproteobacteria bacterium GWA2_45_12]